MKNDLLIVYSTAFATTIFPSLYYILQNDIYQLFPLVYITSDPVYMIPIFFIYGITLGESINGYLVDQNRFRQNRMLFKVIFIFLLSFLRITPLALIFPVSGHFLILTFFFLTEFKIFDSIKKFRILIGLIVLVNTLYFKFIYLDFITPVFGIVIGYLIFNYNIEMINNSD